jgi:hypothetical protein
MKNGALSVEAAKRLGRRHDRLTAKIGDGEIDRPDQRLRAERAGGFRGLLECALVDVHEAEIAAQLRQPECHDLPQATPCAGHDRDLSGHITRCQQDALLQIANE